MNKCCPNIEQGVSIFEWKIKRHHHTRILLHIYEMLDIKFTYSFNGFILFKRRKSDMLITFANLNLTRLRFGIEPIVESWECWIILWIKHFICELFFCIGIACYTDEWFRIRDFLIHTVLFGYSNWVGEKHSILIHQCFYNWWSSMRETELLAYTILMCLANGF